jgi:hypothetical protein
MSKGRAGFLLRGKRQTGRQLKFPPTCQKPGQMSIFLKTFCDNPKPSYFYSNKVESDEQRLKGYCHGVNCSTPCRRTSKSLPAYQEERHLHHLPEEILENRSFEETQLEA